MVAPRALGQARDPRRLPLAHATGKQPRQRHHVLRRKPRPGAPAAIMAITQQHVWESGCRVNSEVGRRPITPLLLNIDTLSHLPLDKLDIDTTLLVQLIAARCDSATIPLTCTL